MPFYGIISANVSLATAAAIMSYVSDASDDTGAVTGFYFDTADE